MSFAQIQASGHWPGTSAGVQRQQDGSVPDYRTQAVRTINGVGLNGIGPQMALDQMALPQRYWTKWHWPQRHRI